MGIEIEYPPDTLVRWDSLLYFVTPATRSTCSLKRKFVFWHTGYSRSRIWALHQIYWV